MKHKKILASLVLVSGIAGYNATEANGNIIVNNLEAGYVVESAEKRKKNSLEDLANLVVVPAGEVSNNNIVITYGTAINLAGNKYLEMKAAPGYEYTTVLNIPEGERFIIIDKSNSKWYEVEYNGEIGFVEGTFVKESIEQYTFKNAEIRNLDKENLYIKSDASDEAGDIGFITTGNKVQVIDEKEDGWCLVKCENGIIGYVNINNFNFV